MLKKINKIILKIVIAEAVLLLALVAFKPLLMPEKSFAAHDVGTPSVFEVKITNIALKDELGLAKTIFSGSLPVDLASVSSFGTALEIAVNVPPGKYIGAVIMCDRYLKVKGQLVLNSVTYYTKTAHTGHTTPSAEIEDIDYGVVDLRSDQTFLAPIELSGNVTMRLIVDTEKVLAYWNGLDGAFKPEISAAGFNIVPLPMALIFGEPGTKEIYEVHDTAYPNSKGRLALIFDASGNFVGGMGRADLTGSNTSSIFFTGGFPISIYAVNADGSINMGAESWNNGSRIAWYMPDFRRTATTSTGSWRIVYTNASGATSGSFTATRVQ
ncbi:MAG: hypothetical protein A2044_02995 [Candidatus Firestonebacteria bacterium GWA2_43_8]|nr:MAG: hypothetical protein A2044_02995 [Candidatus Firestonebacteria bacterium GWA2_43_8]